MMDRDEARRARNRNRDDTAKEQASRQSRNAVKRAQLRACSEYYAASYRNSRSKTWKDIRKFLMASKIPEPRVSATVLDPTWADRPFREIPIS